MDQRSEPGGSARRRMLRGALAIGALLAGGGIAMAQPAAVEIGIHNFVFMPGKVRVKAGTTVTWVNHDDIPHSIVVPSLQVHSHAIDTDERVSVRFDRPGEYPYMCGLHPHMRGEVEVVP